MALSAPVDPEENVSYFANDDYDYSQVAAFTAILQTHFATQMVNGGDTDRLQTSILIGRNSLLLRLDRPQQTMKSASEFVIEAENDRDSEFRQAIPFLILEGETKVTATARWLAAVQASIVQTVRLLRLPMSLPPAFLPAPVLAEPGTTVPAEYLA